MAKEELKDVSGLKQKIKLFALVTNRKTIDYIDEYDEKKIPQVFPQQENDNGSKFYVVPYLYASRLLSGEPYKYFLADPNVISITVPTPSGGRAEKQIYAKVEKVEKRQVYRQTKESKPLAADIRGLNEDDTFDIVLPNGKEVRNVKKTQLAKEEIVIRDAYGLPVLIDKEFN